MAATRRVSPVAWAALFALLALLFRVNVPGIGEVELGEHAPRKHGADALAARDAAVTSGPWGVYDCPDKLYKVTHRPGGRDCLVLIVSKAGLREKTAFAAKRDYVQRMLERDGCVHLYRDTHPLLGDDYGRDND